MTPKDSKAGRRKGLTLWFVCALLVIGTTLQFLSLRNSQWGAADARKANERLQALLPPELPGWSVKDEPIGQTELVQEAAKRELNYDDYVFRVYRRGTIEVGIFISYWGPNRMATHRIISHTPDICWPMNGWNCLQYDLRKIPGAAGDWLAPGYWRRFAPPQGQGVVHVIYWHIAEGAVFDFGGNRFNRVLEPVRWWKEAMRYAIVGTGDQYFIRITSNTPFEQAFAGEDFAGIFGKLGELGLREVRQSPATGGSGN